MSCSRAHTVVGVTFTQKRKNDAGEETAKTSLINLVDLAGRLAIIHICRKIIFLDSSVPFIHPVS